MTPEMAYALGIDVRSDGPHAFIVLRDGAKLAAIERSRVHRHIWRGALMTGELFHGPSVSHVLDQIASNLSPRR